MRKPILIVEDDPDISWNMKTFLESEGFPVATAKNGLAALAYLETNEVVPSLILLDLMMPEMDGWEFRRQQLEHPRFREIPTVVVSAAGTLSRPIVADQFIRKPIDLELLLKTANGSYHDLVV